MNSIDKDDLYLIISDSVIKIDSVMCELSKKNYTSLSRILDTIGKQFQIYKIANSDTNNVKSKEVGNLIVDFNNYKIGYLFFLNDEIKKNSSLVGNVIHKLSRERGIEYKILKQTKKDDQVENRAVIISL